MNKMDIDKFYDFIMDLPIDDRKRFLWFIYNCCCKHLAKVFHDAKYKE